LAKKHGTVIEKAVRVRPREPFSGGNEVDIASDLERTEVYGGVGLRRGPAGVQAPSRGK